MPRLKNLPGKDAGKNDWYCEGHTGERVYVVYAKSKEGFLQGVRDAERDCQRESPHHDDLASEMIGWDKFWKTAKEKNARQLYVVRGDPVIFLFYNEEYELVHSDMLAAY